MGVRESPETQNFCQMLGLPTEERGIFVYVSMPESVWRGIGVTKQVDLNIPTMFKFKGTQRKHLQLSTSGADREGTSSQT